MTRWHAIIEGYSMGNLRELRHSTHWFRYRAIKANADWLCDHANSQYYKNMAIRPHVRRAK